MKAETRFKLKVTKDLKTLKNTWFLKTNEVSTLGIPDFLICCGGKFCAIELKVPGGIISKLQMYNLSKIQKAGGMAGVTTPDHWDKVYLELKRQSLLR